MKKMDEARTRLESLKAEAQAALESGKFDALTADAEGITPKTRIEWLTPSIDYILGVAAGLPQDKVEEGLNGLPASDEDELALAYIGVIEVMSGDQYVSEGMYNVTRALDLLMDDCERARNDDAEGDEVEQGEDESVLDKAKKFFTGKGKKKAKSDKAKPAPKKTRGGDSGDNKAELQELKTRIAKLEAAKADADSRAEKAEAEAKALQAKLKAMGIDT